MPRSFLLLPQPGLTETLGLDGGLSLSSLFYQLVVLLTCSRCCHGRPAPYAGALLAPGAPHSMLLAKDLVALPSVSCCAPPLELQSGCRKRNLPEGPLVVGMEGSSWCGVCGSLESGLSFHVAKSCHENHYVNKTFFLHIRGFSMFF